jgi:TRAP-type uncharacterized transport system substrate-binding protein
VLAALFATAGLGLQDVTARERAGVGRGIKPATGAPQGRRPAQGEDSEAALSERMNANTIAVVSGTPGGTYFRMASDMAFVLDDGDDLRILPVLGKGAGQNAYDVRFLKGIDLGFVRTDTLDQLRQDKRLVNIDRQIAYIARLFNDELHVIASRNITDVRQLEGKKVSFDVKGSGSDYTGKTMFEGLGLRVQALNIDQPTALEMLKRDEIAAVVSVAAKPVAFVSGFDPGGRFHLLDVPYVDAVADKYYPASLSSEDYPKLLDKGRQVNTLAVGTILGVYNWPEDSDRYKRIARFVEAFFSKFDQFSKSARHPKWQEVNLGATVPGWKRFAPAEAWLTRTRANGATASSPRDFQRFLDERRPGADADRDRLFEEFKRWRGAQGQ